MDTYNMELDSIVESFKLDILVIEHENFMNIVYNKSKGVLNESVLLEFKQSKIKILINKIKEAFRKLMEKVKEIIEKFKKVIQSKFFSLSFNELKQLPDDIIIGKGLDTNWIQNNIYPKYKNYINKFQQICDKISKIDTYFVADTPDLNNIKKSFDEMKDIEKDNKDLCDWLFQLFDTDTGNNFKQHSVTYDGKFVKNNYVKILTVMKEGFKLNFDFSNKLYKSLAKADSKLKNIGKNNTYVAMYDGSQRINSSNPKDLKYAVKNGLSYSINNDEKIYPENIDHMTIEFVKEYIDLYKDLCKALAKCTYIMFEIADQYKDIISASLHKLREEGIKTKKHKDYKYIDIEDIDPDEFEDFDEE